MMLSLKKIPVALAVVALVVAVAGATPQRAAAGFGTSPGAPGAREAVVEYGADLTASVTDGTSNTIAAPDNLLVVRKAGGGPKDY